ncbi:type II toxin-antitoxin system RelE/ParE family toxin [Aequorivita marina]|uniref:type II toxin-antitoxin system RelE/ParE family toxin n=1 Tax=Aequorivita marina TaxID=3073654 RepID=UPI0028771CD6|nr:type II toxin-antitoxin system RelE/ParE family toxin [Aequorivita sp. S2608]MDS1297680.1 type II toxin-antitoxin system RelE/ParE family toxin [Aequorivita sp. S2608]
MGVYKLSSKAEFDLEVMYEFCISKFGLIQAQKYFFEMHETFKLLGRNVNLGRDASDYIADFTRFSFTTHTIFYLKAADGIYIIRVLSQRMDYERNLQL